MSFGGFNPFSSSSSKDSSSASSASSSSTPTESSNIKSRLTTAITTQSNILNARHLISKVNEICFAHCVTAPGSSLSSREQACLSSCMEKYIDAWNVVSRTYISRLQKERVQLGLPSGPGSIPAAGAAGSDSGKELF